LQHAPGFRFRSNKGCDNMEKMRTGPPPSVLAGGLMVEEYRLIRVAKQCSPPYCVKGTKALIIAAMMVLAGCGAIRGAPEPVLDVKQARGDLAAYLSGDVLLRFYAADNQARGGITPLEWRDAVIAARLEIADQNYQTFKNELYAETVGMNLAVDLAALGLSGAGAVAGGSAARVLSVATAGVIGAGTAFNRDTLYQKTLPAIFAQMEANRTGVLVYIRTAQLQDGTKYPLSTALSDLSAYERASTLEEAIQVLTTTATNKAQANKEELVQITGLTILPRDVQARKQAFSDYIQGLIKSKNKTKLDQIAVKIGVATDDNIIRERANILRSVDSRVNGDNAASAMTALSTLLNPITGKTF
jgi:hypothetical protein